MNELTCPKCGSNDSVHQTQFDHPDGERLIDLMRCLDCGATFEGDSYRKTDTAPDHWYMTELRRRMDKFEAAHARYTRAVNNNTASWAMQKESIDAAYHLALYLASFGDKVGLAPQEAAR